MSFPAASSVTTETTFSSVGHHALNQPLSTAARTRPPSRQEEIDRGYSRRRLTDRDRPGRRRAIEGRVLKVVHAPQPRCAWNVSGRVVR